MTEAEEKAVEYLKANSLVRLSENNEVVAYGNSHKYYIINLIEKLQKENEELRHSYDIATTKTEELKKKLGLKQFDVNVVYNDYLEKLREFKSNSVPKNKIRELANYFENGEQEIKFNWVMSKYPIAVEDSKWVGKMLKELLEEE